MVRFRTNEDGITPYTAKRIKNESITRIMFFGDSMVAGRNVEQDTTVNAHLERMLLSRGIRAEALNAGVQGYSTDQALLRMKSLVPLYRPDIIVYAVCSNDFGANVSKEAYDIPKPTFIIKDNGRLEELPPPFKNRTPFAKTTFKKSIQHSALYRFLQPKIFSIRSKFMKWNELNMIGLADDFYYHPEALEQFDWRLFIALLNEMKSVSGEYDAEFCFYKAPELGEVWNPYIESTEKKLSLAQGAYDRHVLENRMSEIAKEQSILFVPMVDYFAANQSRGPFHMLPRDNHCNGSGYELTAEVIADFICKSGLSE